MAFIAHVHNYCPKHVYLDLDPDESYEFHVSDVGKITVQPHNMHKPAQDADFYRWYSIYDLNPGAIDYRTHDPSLFVPCNVIFHSQSHRQGYTIQQTVLPHDHGELRLDGAPRHTIPQLIAEMNDPELSVERLDEIIEMPMVMVRRLALQHPNTKIYWLILWSHEHPADVAANPALPMAIMLDHKVREHLSPTTRLLLENNEIQRLYSRDL
jgi:hypothetical protein